MAEGGVGDGEQADLQRELDVLKKEVASIVLANKRFPTAGCIHQLYKSLNGKFIDFWSFGFESLDQLFTSFSDKLITHHCSDGYLRYEVIPDATISNIRQLVEGQRDRDDDQMPLWLIRPAYNSAHDFNFAPMDFGSSFYYPPAEANPFFMPPLPPYPVPPPGLFSNFPPGGFSHFGPMSQPPRALPSLMAIIPSLVPPPPPYSQPVMGGPPGTGSQFNMGGPLGTGSQFGMGGPPGTDHHQSSPPRAVNSDASTHERITPPIVLHNSIMCSLWDKVVEVSNTFQGDVKENKEAKVVLLAELLKVLHGEGRWRVELTALNDLFGRAFGFPLFEGSETVPNCLIEPPIADFYSVTERERGLFLDPVPETLRGTVEGLQSAIASLYTTRVSDIAQPQEPLPDVRYARSELLKILDDLLRMGNKYPRMQPTLIDRLRGLQITSVGGECNCLRCRVNGLSVPNRFGMTHLPNSAGNACRTPNNDQNDLPTWTAPAPYGDRPGTVEHAPSVALTSNSTTVAEIPLPREPYPDHSVARSMQTEKEEDRVHLPLDKWVANLSVCMKVGIECVRSVSEFFIYDVNFAKEQQYDSMNSQIGRFYDSSSAENLILPQHFIQPGAIVVVQNSDALRRRVFKRAVIVSTERLKDEVEVLLVDDGQTRVVPHDACYKIDKRFTKLPRRMAPARLRAINLEALGLSNAIQAKEMLMLLKQRESNAKCMALEFDQRSMRYVVDFVIDLREGERTLMSLLMDNRGIDYNEELTEGALSGFCTLLRLEAEQSVPRGEARSSAVFAGNFDPIMNSLVRHFNTNGSAFAHHFEGFKKKWEEGDTSGARELIDILIKQYTEVTTTSSSGAERLKAQWVIDSFEKLAERMGRQ